MSNTYIQCYLTMQYIILCKFGYHRLWYHMQYCMKVHFRVALFTCSFPDLR